MRGDPGDSGAWVRIAVVTYNSGAHTQACLDALAAQSDPAFTAIIVDNDSSDGAIDGLRLPDARFTLVRNTVNNGFAGGSNQGVRQGREPYVMTLNPDTRLDPDCLARLHQAARDHAGAAMLSPLLWQEASPPVLDGAGDTLSLYGIAWRNGHGRAWPDATGLEVCEVFGPSGAAALYRRDRFEAVGGFDESFFCYFEDVDLALRLRARKDIALLVPDANGIHIGGHSTAGLPGFAIRQTSRNALSSMATNAPLALLPVMLALHVIAHAWFQFRNRRTPVARFRSDGFRQGLARLPQRLWARTRRRPYPIGASLHVARRLSWTIRDVNARRFVSWPAPQRPGSPPLSGGTTGRHDRAEP
ncbi:glycosyltransferase family 2 protein [uncultured Algimonas sp.]|uniref:glycosyltransferase family 2 protein n=1 Tax=uncultured Algimonas sp. TaxID=1547920 RepID=UPI002627D205|nr:glycosyltransferase family 2 protein [uncultured Algimonas sp.]